MLLLWFALIYALDEFIEPVTKTARYPIHITVGPGCLAVPTPTQPEAVFNAADNVTCPFNPTVANKLGPVITARGGADWKQLLAAVKTAETSTKNQVFHYAFDFESANLTCAEKATAGTVGSASPCASGECLVHYYAGEFFLAASPGWLKASSLGLLSADSHSVVVTLKEGVRPATTAR